MINRLTFKAKKCTLKRHGSAAVVLQKEDEEDIRDADIVLKNRSKKRGLSLKAMKKKLGI